jgi:hypothetical protein
MTTALPPVAAASPAGPPVRWVFGAPTALFDSLRENPTARRPVRLLLLILPLLPIGVALQVNSTVREALAGEGTDRAAAAPFLALAAGVAILAVQALIAGTHLLLFMMLCRLVKNRNPGSAIFAVWAYAVAPLVARQLLYLGIGGVAGPDWFAERGGLVAIVDPFLIWVAVLLWIGCRRTLQLAPKPAALVVGVSSGLGLLAIVPTLLA